LAGGWPVEGAAADALIASGAWVADLSAPPATPARVVEALGERFISIDDLATPREAIGATQSIEDRLDRLIAETVAEHERWLGDAPRRSAARALADRAEHARDAELEALFDRVRSLDDDEREAVARMADRLTARLLRDPLERLRADGDGRHGRAARELFGL
jgi:glutamyl-tRNA reductase